MTGRNDVSERISQWLRKLGLGQYAETFSANSIDEHILPELSDADLKELGVVALGHRKTILKAIANLSQVGDEAVQSPARSEQRSESPSADPGVELAAWQRHPGERKPVTMLFADITGSTALTEKLDAEEAHDVLYGATQRMCEAVEKNRGTVCRFMGDGLMAMFGAPVGSEHHAVDACEAALAMQELTRLYAKQIEARYGSSLQIRVGLHSGEVVVLRVGEGENAEYDASGPTVSIAARMEQTAQPGESYITGATRLLAEHRIDAEELSPVAVKGISEPVPVYVLRRMRSLEQAISARAHTPFVGRRGELNQFRAVLNTCIDEGLGQTVYVRGEPGIGKTRLVGEFSRMSASRGMACHHVVIRDFGVGRGHDAIRALVRSLLNIPADGDERTRARGVRSAIQDALIDPDREMYLNDLLDLPQPTELRALYDAMDNATRNQRKQAVVSDLLVAVSRRRPILTVVEDVHWADPLALAYLALLTRTVSECPALLVITGRVESEPLDQQWRSRTEGGPFVTIDLGPLRRQDSIELMKQFMDPSDPLADDYLKRASGNPLFLEQLLQNPHDGSDASLPDSIQSLVLARLDRLQPQAKHALQAASILGQRFEDTMLRHLLGAPEPDYAQLLRHQLIRHDGSGYAFAHALIQEGVYGSLLKRQREQWHRKAASWFADKDVLLHAEHLASAEDPEAPSAFLRAAREQAGNYHFERALTLAERGLARTATQSDRHELTCLKGELLRDLGNVKSSIAVYGEALESADDDEQRFDAWMGLAAGHRMKTNFDAALKLLDKAEIVGKSGRLVSRMAALHHLRGNLLFSLGRAEDCRNEHLLALTCAQQTESAEIQARALGGLGDAEYARGRLITAGDHYGRCIDLSRRHGFGRIEVAHLGQRGLTRLYSGDWRGARDAGVAALDVATRIGDRRIEMNACMCVCACNYDIGERDSLAEYAERTLVAARALDARAWKPVAMMWQAIAFQEANRLDEARELLMEAASIIREVGRAFNAGRVLGALALVTADDDQAREAALSEGEAALREGAISHNYFWFYRFAMDALLGIGEWERVERYAAALDEYTRSEPLPWTEFFIARARALAAFGRGKHGNATLREIERLRNEGNVAGLKGPVEALESALAAT